MKIKEELTLTHSNIKLRNTIWTKLESQVVKF